VPGIWGGEWYSAYTIFVMQGKLIIIFGPSGAGKGQLIGHIRQAFPSIVFPVSRTTRAPRPGEKAGEVYDFITEEEFQRHIDSGEFLEWAHFGGHRYGTLKSEVLPALAAGKIVLRELDIQGIDQVRTIIPREQLVIIFIDAGSWSDMEARIRARAPITEEELAERKKRYEAEIAGKETAHIVINNPDGELEFAKQELSLIIQSLVTGAAVV
jgi:guanylate kinase